MVKIKVNFLYANFNTLFFHQINWFSTQTSVKVLPTIIFDEMTPDRSFAGRKGKKRKITLVIDSQLDDWKHKCLTCYCHMTYRVEAVGLLISKDAKI